MLEFQVTRSNLHQFRLIESDALSSIQNGEVLVRIERFSFTANNITYGVAGDQLGYWHFFPPHGEDTSEQGILPVWGFAEVIESKSYELPMGDRLYGYFPPAEKLKMRPTNVSKGQFIDGSEHRSKLPPGYNVYRRVEAEPGYNRAMDNHRALLFPLHVTSFCLWDSLQDKSWYQAEQIIVLSASSKTSLGLGFALKEDANAPSTIGLTSTRNAEFVANTEYFDQTLTYDQLEKIDTSKPTVIVDMSGNGDLLGKLHKALGDSLKHCINVGMTHWDEGVQNKDINAEKSEFFFAPGHIQKRLKDWGPQGFAEKSGSFLMKSAQASANWLKVKEVEGLAELETYYPQILDGKFAPEEGLIIKL